MSEYRINGSACRLKDINEMFYDTGIGKEGYSIIGQGQIDKILSGKPGRTPESFLTRQPVSLNLKDEKYHPEEAGGRATESGPCHGHFK